MSTPLRTKRNFKSLQLPVDDPIAPAPPPPDASPGPVPTRLAPAGPQPLPNKRRPPPLGDAPPVQGFLSPGGIDSAVGSGVGSGRHSALHATLAKMELHAPRDVEITDLKNADLRNLAELGQGNGGSVMKVEHVPSGMVMAKKIVLIDAKPSVRKQILRELQIMHSCKSPYIVSSYGAFLAEPNICICMEFMDKGSFDGIYKKIGAIDIEVVRQVAHAVLEGLMYLYDVHRIIHRDIKPSNILCNSLGEIKLCDFGVSGELINSIAHTFVGTSIYMSPERIQGAEYSVKSDVWSLGISLIELALGRFPFSDPSDSDDENYSDLEGDPTQPSPAPSPAHSDLAKTAKLASSPDSGRTARRHSRRKSKGVSLDGGGMTMSIIELMHQIVKEPAPRLGPEGRFEKAAEEFVDACLEKDPERRKAPKDLLAYEWMVQAAQSTFDLKEWAGTF
ncbi:putative serine/Threonine protein kinases, catalytic domain [Lyophyllum shimeji]|uniref:Serine/Threonine protein kinases, catalytic domain n=1 Tax=Lyophyllum shimeji TaxID=47721 RepID=A0A9P3Q134_LYOSH|nr:putative serine/Threonine protein kinases, catalytic domain [Lyophyllum shimeji]